MSWHAYPVPSRRLRFGRTEVRHILLALAVLTLAFALAFAGGFRASLWGFAAALILASVAVPTGFLLHEMGHKVVAQRYGCLAEFRSYTYGLMLALLTAPLGIIFAAPGAVVIQGYVTGRQNGHISLAGPAVNLLIGAAFLLVWLYLGVAGWDAVLLNLITVQRLSYGVAFINLFLGAFNMLPFPPLDGSKIIAWSPRTYALLMGSIVVLLAVLFLL